MAEPRRITIPDVKDAIVGTANTAGDVYTTINVTNNEGDSYSAPNAQIGQMGGGGTAEGTMFRGSTTARAKDKSSLTSAELLDDLVEENFTMSEQSINVTGFTGGTVGTANVAGIVHGGMGYTDIVGMWDLHSSELLNKMNEARVSLKTLKIFSKNDITGAVFLDGNLEDLLEDFGITDAMDKRKLNILRKRLEDPSSLTASELLDKMREAGVSSKTRDALNDITGAVFLDGDLEDLLEDFGITNAMDKRKLNILRRKLEAEGKDSREDEECYKMDAVPRGLCYIFNNKTFKDTEDKTRRGTENDGVNLERVFKKLMFTVTTFPDYSAADMEKKVEDLSKENHESYDCVIVIFLTHGNDGSLEGSDSKSLNINKITSFFEAEKCRSLANKPKLFFLQACRGSHSLKASIIQDDGTEATVSGKEVMNYVAPVEDFFLGFSTVSGSKSKRNPEAGSWYIQELVRVFDKYADKKDLNGLMTMVKNRVSKHLEQLEDGQFHKQTPANEDLLRKLVYFK